MKHTQRQKLQIAASKCNQPWFAAKRAYAAASQQLDIQHSGVRRVTRPDAPAYEMVVPEYLAPTTNTNVRIHHTVYGRIKTVCLSAMKQQIFPPKQPLTGRPVVLFTRFTSSEPDPTSDWSKIPLDCLLTYKVTQTKTGTRVRNGVGILSDDSSRAIDYHQWWEPGERNDGFVWIRIYRSET